MYVWCVCVCVARVSMCVCTPRHPFHGRRPLPLLFRPVTFTDRLDATSPSSAAVASHSHRHVASVTNNYARESKSSAMVANSRRLAPRAIDIAYNI